MEYTLKSILIITLINKKSHEMTSDGKINQEYST